MPENNAGFHLHSSVFPPVPGTLLTLLSGLVAHGGFPGAAAQVTSRRRLRRRVGPAHLAAAPSATPAGWASAVSERLLLVARALCGCRPSVAAGGGQRSACKTSQRPHSWASRDIIPNLRATVLRSSGDFVFHFILFYFIILVYCFLLFYF